MIDPKIDSEMATIIGELVEYLQEEPGGFEVNFAGMVNAITNGLRKQIATGDVKQQVYFQCGLLGSMCVAAEAKRRGIELPIMRSRLV